jgi:hypothetical protein
LALGDFANARTSPGSGKRLCLSQTGSHRSRRRSIQHCPRAVLRARLPSGTGAASLVI